MAEEERRRTRMSTQSGCLPVASLCLGENLWTWMAHYNRMWQSYSIGAIKLSKLLKPLIIISLTFKVLCLSQLCYFSGAFFPLYLLMKKGGYWDCYFYLRRLCVFSACQFDKCYGVCKIGNSKKATRSPVFRSHRSRCVCLDF